MGKDTERVHILHSQGLKMSRQVMQLDTRGSISVKSGKMPNLDTYTAKTLYTRLPTTQLRTMYVIRGCIVCSPI